MRSRESAPVRAVQIDNGSTYQVVSEELHDQGGVLIALLTQGVKLCTSLAFGMHTEDTAHTSNGIIESKLGKVASLVGRVEDLIVEDGEVKSQAQTDGVGRGEVGLSDLRGALVGLERSISGTLTAVANGKLGQIAVVVTLPVIPRY